MSRAKSFMENLNSFLQRLEHIKRAEDARLEGGENSRHPSEKDDDRTMDPEEGFRSQENEDDVSEMVTGGGPDEADENPKDDVNVVDTENVGASATGELPEVEDNYGSRPEDVPTDHPANAQFGEKYSSWNISDIRREFGKLANSILTDLVTGCGLGLSGASYNGHNQNYGLNDQYLHMPKQAEDHLMNKMAADLVKTAIVNAIDMADAVGDFIEMYKSAEDAAAEQNAMSALAAMSGADSSQPDVNEDVEEKAPAESLPPALPQEEELEGEEEEISKEDEDEALQHLVMALEELGISPEELAEADSGDVESAGLPSGEKLAYAAELYKRSGKYKKRLPKTASERVKIDFMKSYIKELVNR